MNLRGSVSRHACRFTHLYRILAVALTAASCDGGDPIDPGTGAAAALLVVSGDGQSGSVGTQLAQDFVVRVNDGAGNPVANVAVTWAVTAGGGSITPTNGTTDAAGHSQARLTLGPSVGANTASASVSGVSSVNFTANGVTGGGGGGPAPGTLAFRTIDAGSYHTCAIGRNELAYCWGFNQDGELGNGSTAMSMQAVATAGGLNFRQVSGGKYHSCGVTLSGEGYCWGSNLEGQLGREVEVQSETPVLNSRAITFGSISVGRAHSCGLTLTGVAVCWGSNIGGGLGYATAHTSSDTAGFVRTSQIFRRIASGGLHNCALNNANQAYCWGYNDQGQLGNGTTTTIFPDTALTAPPWVLPVSGGLAFDSITAGYRHTCALTSAGAAYCWGDNSWGQLGDGTSTRSLVPVPVAGGLSFASLSAGYYHTCGILITGEAHCWGRNTPNAIQETAGGQIGDGTTTNRPSPALVSGGLLFQSISAGEISTCGVTTTGVAYCWGDNEYGQLGTGTTASFLVPTRIAGQP
jgi:alpha-tubulin suppressor-like RCC1 family protein